MPPESRGMSPVKVVVNMSFVRGQNETTAILMIIYWTPTLNWCVKVTALKIYIAVFSAVQGAYDASRTVPANWMGDRLPFSWAIPTISLPTPSSTGISPQRNRWNVNLLGRVDLRRNSIVEEWTKS